MKSRQAPRRGRRRLLQTLSGAGGAALIAKAWHAPLVRDVVLPAHAVLSGFSGNGEFATGEIEAEVANTGIPLLDIIVPKAYAPIPTVEKIAVCITVVNLIAVIEVYICGTHGEGLYKQTNVDVSANLSDMEIPHASGYDQYGPSADNKVFIDGQFQANGDKFEFIGIVKHSLGQTSFTAVDGGECIKPECCFLAGTLVWMADGSYKAIEDVVLGDLVISRDFATSKSIVSPVTKLHRAAAPEYLRLNDLYVTGAHPFAIGNEKWSPAAALHPGAIVYGGEGPLPITDTETIHQAADVFNLRVEGAHNYFVGDKDRMYLVHNKA